MEPSSTLDLHHPVDHGQLNESPPLKKPKLELELTELLMEHEEVVTDTEGSRLPSVLAHNASLVAAQIDSIPSLAEVVIRLEQTVNTRFRLLEKKLDGLTRKVNSISSSKSESRRSEPVTRSLRSRSAPDIPTPSSQPKTSSFKPELPLTPVKPAEPEVPVLPTDLSKVPRERLFKIYLPRNWFFLSFAELVFSCFRFYESPITVDFLHDSVKDVPVLNRATLVAKKCSDLTPSWHHCINQALETHKNYVKREGLLLSLNHLGRRAFTSVGINFGTGEGQRFSHSQRRLRKVEVPPRNLPDDFEFRTVFDMLNLPHPPAPLSDEEPEEVIHRRRNKPRNSSRWIYEEVSEVSEVEENLAEEQVDLTPAPRIDLSANAMQSRSGFSRPQKLEAYVNSHNNNTSSAEVDSSKFIANMIASKLMHS
ncbi:hypothetical protein RCL1_003314 [Eukaryota sp. TZLM3-RCL]